MKPSRGFGWLLPLIFFLISTEALQNETEHEFEEGEIQREIDNEIAKYLEDVRQVLQKDEKRKLMKRSTSANGITLSKLEEAPRFSSIERLYVLPDPFAVDVVVFCLLVEQDDKCFAASLLTSDTENVDQLVLYKLNGDKFTRSDKTEVKNGRSLATHNIAGVQYIVVAENRNYSDDSVSDLFVSPVFAVDAKLERLERLHFLGDRHLTDAIIWEQTGTDHIFLATASAAIINAAGGQYGDQSHVYRWMGNHFDITHTISSNNASRITQFTIGGNMFLAVANTGTDSQDGTNVFSAVYMYNLHDERFVLHQKLLTHGATDLKFFTLQFGDETETFLVVSNSGHTPYSDEPCIVIYKLLPDSYHFLPLQCLRLEGGAEMLLPVVHKDKTGVLASVLFVVNRNLGLKVYQYDGWRFVESESQLNQQEFGPGITSMRLFDLRGRNVVTLVNKRSISLIFRVMWKVNDVMKALHSDLESWCDQVLKDEEELETVSNNLLHEALLAPKLNESIDVGGSLVFDNPNTHIHTIEVTNTGVIKPDNESVKKKFEEVKQDVEKNKEMLKELTKKELIFDEPVVLESADFKCHHGCVFLDLEIETLNGENLSTFLENSHGLTKKHIDKIEFESLNVTSHTDVDKINGRPVKYLATSSNDHNNRFDINVNGKVTFNGNLTVNSEIDGVKFDSNLLLDGGDQVFNNSKLSVDSLIVDKLTVKYPVQDKLDKIVEVEGTGKNFIPSLYVKDLTLVDNKISGIDFGNFVEKTLKKTSDKEQIVEGYHHYKVLIAEEIDASNFERTTEKGVKLGDNVVEDLIVDRNKNVVDNVDKIDEKLDLTLSKTCSGVECVEDQFRIDGDFEIDGSLVIENGTLFVSDVHLDHENVSFGDLLENGLRLDSGVISDVLFNAPIYVEHLNVDTVNHIDPNTWIDGCHHGSEPIVVTGHKIFTDGLNLEKGGTVTDKINDIPYDSLMYDTLKKDGDQDVEGFKHIGKITAKVIESDSLAMEKNDITGKAKTHSGGDLVVNRMKGTLLKAKTINDVVLEDVINDTLFKDNKTYRIESKTTFLNDLKTEELFCDDVSELSNHINERRMTGDLIPVKNTSNFANVNLTAADVNGKLLKIDRLYFTGSFDGISSDDFGNWLLVDGDQTIKNICKIKNIEAKNGVKLTSNQINGVDIDETVKDMVNISEPIRLSSVIFEDEVKVENGVNVGGLVNGVEFSEKELVLRDCKEKVIFTGEKVLDGDLEAESLDVDELTFCKVFGDPRDEHQPPQLIVVGNVVFSSEPTIKILNNRNISTLMDSLWFVDEDIIIDHDMDFEKVVFKCDINMNPDSELNGMNLTRLSGEYFSLTADQKITKEMIFDKMAADGLTTVTGRVEAYDSVSGMKFDEFVNSVLRQKRRQRVTAILDFEDVEVDGVLNVNSSGTINGLDFKNDLMRWNNTLNVVRGKTYITSLKTQSLEAKHGVLIQGIDISKWKLLAVTNSGNFKVSGQKTFHSNVYVDKDLRVHGLVNGFKFEQDSVLLNDRNQTINGYYQFGAETVLEVQDLLSNNLVDGVNMTYLLDQHVCKDDSNLLITGKKTFKSRFSTANQVEMRRHFQDVDLLQLYNQLMNPYDGLARDNRLNRLRSIRKDVEMSLARRAFLFIGWEKVAHVKGKVRLVLPLGKSMEHVVFLGKFSGEEKRVRLSLNYWDARKRMFVETGARRTFIMKPTDATVVETASGENRLFTLFKTSNASVMTGVIYNVSCENGSLNHISVGTFDTSGANRMLYLTDDCSLLWGVGVPQCHIYCSWQLVHNFACSDVNEIIIKSTNETTTLVLIAKSTGYVEVRRFVENELQYVAEVTVSKQPVLRMDVIPQPLTHHFILVACSDTVVTFIRFDPNWQQMDSAAIMLQKASARLLTLPTNEVIAIVMSSCSAPTTYKWAGLSQPQATSLPIGGSEIRQVYQFQDTLEANYTLIVSDRETAVLKPLFFIDNFES